MLPFIEVSVHAQAKPNLVLIVADQVRFDAMGRAQEAMGVVERSRIRTPNLDRISREGAWFRNGYAHCAVCGPSRTSFLTGRTITHTGVIHNGLADDEALKSGNAAAWERLQSYRTYNQILVKDQGYRAEFYGKWHSPESMGWIYANDLRVSGGGRPWFGKFNPDQSRRYPASMNAAYLDTLNRNKVGPVELAAGQLRNTFTQRAYVPDPLDSRFGNPEGPTSQPDLHGKDLIPDPWSITAVEGRETVDALDRLSRGAAPFSLSISFHSPHAPMVPTEKFYAMYAPADMQVSPSIGDAMENSAYKGANGMGNRPEYRDPAKVKRWMADYYGLVTEVDEWIGAIMEKLRASGQDRNTLVAFISDHGEMLGAHGLREKNIFYEESAHIPMLLWMPGRIPGGTVVDQPVSTLDLHATVLDYLGLDPKGFPSDGKSLRTLVEGKALEDPFVVTQWDPTSNGVPVFMIRKGDWKLMLPNRASSGVLDMLFNLKQDPYEMNNLLGKSGPTASEAVLGKAEHLKALLAEYLRRMEDPLAGEVEKRRTWRTARLWVSDSVIDFGALKAGSSKEARLYIGSTAGGNVTVSGIALEGEGVERFSLDWTQGVLAAGGSQAVRITYRDGGAGPRDGNVRLVINHDAGGAARVVRLLRPGLEPSRVSRFDIEGRLRAGMGFRYANRVLHPQGLGDLEWRVKVFTPQGRALGSYRGKGSSGIAADLPPGVLGLKWETSDGLTGGGMLVSDGPL